MHAVDVADEVVVEEVVALAPRKLPDAHLARVAQGTLQRKYEYSEW